MNHLRLIVACTAVALSTTAMACDDDDEAPAERGGTVVQARLAAGTQAPARQHKVHARGTHEAQAARTQPRSGRQAEPRANAIRPQPAAPSA